MIFAANSRYQNIQTVRLERPDGTQVVYLRRRWLPQPELLHLVREHVVSERDRIDNIAARHLSDPEQYWRICDANRAMRPAALTEVIGRRLRITMPEGVPGATLV
jgi:hypothetical protein